VCRVIRGSERVFGGLQVVFVMDPRQLPPVPDSYIGDEGLYCFQSKVWAKTFVHKVDLSTNYRTVDSELKELVKECFIGDVSGQSLQVVNELSRPLEGKETTHLYGTNDECLIHNAKQLDQMEGDLITFVAKDTGHADKLDGKRVPQKLSLKVSNKL
jgi:hypothetical protein